MQGVVRKKIICLIVGAAVCVLLTFHRRSFRNIPDLVRRVPHVSPISKPPEATSPPPSVFIPGPDVLSQMDVGDLNRLKQRHMENLQIHCPRKTIYGGVGHGWYTCDLKRGDNPPHCDAFVVLNDETPESKSFFYEVDIDYGCRKHVFLKRGMDKEETLKPLKSAVKRTTEKNANRQIYFMAISLNGNEDTLVAWMIQKKLLRNVQQLFVTFHGIDDKSSQSDHIQHLTVLKALYRQGFRTFHYLLNPQLYYNFDLRKWISKGRYTLYMMRDLPTIPPIVIQPVEDLKQMSLSHLGELYHSYMHSSQEHCRDVVRVGQTGDGGWNMCNATEYRPSQNCLVYSFGINNDWGFDDAISSDYGCEVHSFDPSMGVNDHKRSDKITFHNLGLSDKNGKMNGHWKGMNLQSIIHSLGHDKRIIDIVKMDIEGSEWSAMDSFIPSGVLKNIRQLYFEFHKGVNPTKDDRKRIINLRKLYNNSFRLFWGHPNQVKINLGRYKETGREVTGCYEEYYVNVKLKRSV